MRTPNGISRVAALPVAAALVLLAIWQVATIVFDIPRILLPAPADIAVALVRHAGDLAVDVQQTVLRAALPGYACGNLVGFALAIAVDRSAFLRRGLLPVGQLFSAMPIVAVAPIMVMWFGFDWPSKAAVVALMCFFPMFVATGAGLASASDQERDLMRSYAAGYGRTLLSLRLPTAMPHIFTALRLNAPAAMIGALVSEFFGSPTYGLGFRMTSELGRLGLDIVWAAIVVVAVCGSVLYRAVAAIENRASFWHPSVRDRRELIPHSSPTHGASARHNL